MKLKNYTQAALIVGCNDASMTQDQTAKTEAAILNALSSLKIDGASISYGLGVWKGKIEKNITVSIINNFTSGRLFSRLIDQLYIILKSELQQEDVAIIYQNIKSNL